MSLSSPFFFFNDTATTEIYTLSLHDVLPICRERLGDNLYSDSVLALDADTGKLKWHYQFTPHDEVDYDRSEEHTSELQSLRHLVCRLLLEKKKKKTQIMQQLQHHKN